MVPLLSIVVVGFSVVVEVVIVVEMVVVVGGSIVQYLTLVLKVMMSK